MWAPMVDKTLQRGFGLDASEEDLIATEVADALAATAEERMAAAITLLDTAYELWRSRGLADDAGLCRFPGCAQQRRRGLCRDRGDGGPGADSLQEAAGRSDKDKPDVARLRKLKKERGEA